MKAEFSGKIKYFGFIMTCGMVLYHCPVIDSIPAVSSLDLSLKTLTDSVFRSSVNLIMCYFFAVTGFLLFQDFSLKKYPSKIKRRVFSLLIPYVLWQVIAALIEILTTECEMTLVDFLNRTFLLYAWPVDAPLWYVYAVFLLALVSPLLLLLLKRKNISWAILFVVFFLCSQLSRLTIPSLQKIFFHGYVANIIVYLPAYLAGAFYGYHHKDASPGCLSYILLAQLPAFLLNERFDGFFSYVTMALLPLALLYIIPPVRILENRKIYRLSFLMYALHRPLYELFWPELLSLYTHSLGRIITSAAVASVLTRFFALAGITGLCALLYFILSRLAPRLLALLTGGRA